MRDIFFYKGIIWMILYTVTLQMEKSWVPHGKTQNIIYHDEMHQGHYITLGIDCPTTLAIISLAHRIYCIGPRLLLFQLIFSIALLRKSVYLLGKQTMYVFTMHSRTYGTNRQIARFDVKEYTYNKIFLQFHIS